MVCKIGLTIFMIVELVAFAFVLIGTPLAMFREKNNDESTSCLTMWGYKADCSGKEYDWKPSDLFSTDCERRQTVFEATEACAIISILVCVACVVIAFLMCCCSCCTFLCRIILVILIVVGIGSGAATFGCMAYVYKNESGGSTTPEPETKLLSGVVGADTTAETAPGADEGGATNVIPSGLCGELKEKYKYGVGFILFLVGWCLHTVNIGFALLPA